MNLALYFNLLVVAIAFIVWTISVVYLKNKKRKSNIYIIFFTIFYIYIFQVINYTISDFQSLVILKLFMPNLILKGQMDGKSLNLIPLFTLTAEDIQTSLLNILMLIPFGFGLPFITKLKFKKVIFYGMLFSLSIEIVQLLTGIIAKVSFRIADINDVIFNTLGALIGYSLFVLFLMTFRRTFYKGSHKNSLFKYIAERPQVEFKTER